MSLSVPNYPNPNSTTPLSAAYVWIDTVNIDFNAGTGLVVARVNADAASAAAGLPPVQRIPFTLGQQLAPGVTFPTLSQLIALTASIATANPTFDPFAAERAALYQSLMLYPPFAGATEVA